VTAWEAGLLAATALHAGFQLTVTVVVYPALAHVATDRWAEAHGRHSRTIAPVVAVVYGATLLACVGATLTDVSPGVLVADAGTLVAFAVTAFLAAPTHGRLTPAPQPELLRRLLLVDRLRLVGALTAVTGALAVVLG
jgi:hypothetical protein